jgi:hypothetical protein
LNTDVQSVGQEASHHKEPLPNHLSVNNGLDSGDTTHAGNDIDIIGSGVMKMTDDGHPTFDNLLLVADVWLALQKIVSVLKDRHKKS